MVDMGMKWKLSVQTLLDRYVEKIWELKSIKPISPK